MNEIDVKQFKQFLALQKDESKKILSRAINKTLPGVRTDAVDEIYKVLALTKTTIRKYMTIKKSTANNLTGIFDVTGKPIPLINYQATSVKAGVSVRILRGESKTTVKHAFIATMKSGHRGVFWREDKRRGAVWPIGVKRAIPTWDVLPGEKYRLKIHELYGMRASDVLDHGTHMQVVLQKAGDRYDANASHEYDYWLSTQRGLFD